MEEIILATIVKLSAKYNIDPELVTAIVKVESNFNPKAVGASHKERGLMQLHPKYFPTATFSVKGNLEQGIRHLVSMRPHCIQKYGKGAWFVCYNVGANSKIKNAIKQSYYKKVMHAKAKNSARGIASYKSKDAKSQVHTEDIGREGRSSGWRICSGREYDLHRQGAECGSYPPYPASRNDPRSYTPYEWIGRRSDMRRIRSLANAII